MPSDCYKVYDYYYMCTIFGVDSSSRFHVRERSNKHTNTHTDVTEYPTHASGYAGMGNYVTYIVTVSYILSHLVLSTILDKTQDLPVFSTPMSNFRIF